MKTVKDYTSFVNENVKEEVITESVVDVELDGDVVDYYLELVEAGADTLEATDQVAADFGISTEAVQIICDEAGIKLGESLSEEFEEEEEEEEDEVNESADEDKYLTAKQKKLPEGLKKGIIKKAKKSAGDKSKDDDKDEKDEKDSKDDKKDDKKSDKKDKDEKDSKDEKETKGGSDEDKYLSAKQKKLPEGLKKAIIAKAKKKK